MHSWMPGSSRYEINFVDADSTHGNTPNAPSPLPVGQSLATSAVVNGMIYVIGGFIYSDTSLIYDPATNSWSTGASLPIGKSGAVSAVVNGKIYVMGGQGGNENENQIYDPVTNTWSTGAPLPIATYNGSGAVVNGKIYVIGGLHEHIDTVVKNNNIQTNTVASTQNTTQIYDPVANTWSIAAPLPQAVEQMTSAAVNGKIYVLGGDGGVDYNQIYDPVKNRWSRGALMPVGRGGTGSAVVKGKIYVFGGFGDSENYNQIYDPAKNSWSTGAVLPIGVNNMTGAVVNGKIYVMGGANSTSMEGSDANQVYDPATNTWVVSAQPPPTPTTVEPNAKYPEWKTGAWKQATGFNYVICCGQVNGFYSFGKLLLADASCPSEQPGATGDSLFVSKDDGQTWTDFAPNGGVPLLAVGNPSTPTLLGMGDTMPGTHGEIKMLEYSTNLGQTWIPDTLGWPVPDGMPMTMISVGNTILIGSAYGVSQQSSPGARWMPTGLGGGFLPVTALVESGNLIFAALGMMGGISVSSDNGASWFRADSGLPMVSYEGWGRGYSLASGFAQSGNSLFVMITHDSTNTSYDFYCTTNKGQYWSRMDSTPLKLSAFVPKLVVSGKNLFVESYDRGIFVSPDSGKTWYDANQGFPGLQPDQSTKTSVHGDTTSVQMSFSSSDNTPRFMGIHAFGRNLMVGCGDAVWFRNLSDFDTH